MKKSEIYDNANQAWFRLGYLAAKGIDATLSEVEIDVDGKREIAFEVNYTEDEG